MTNPDDDTELPRYRMVGYDRNGGWVKYSDVAEPADRLANATAEARLAEVERDLASMTTHRDGLSDDLGAAEARIDFLIEQNSKASVRAEQAEDRADAALEALPELLAALKAVTERLNGFVGAVADITDCSADVEALKLADAAIAKVSKTNTLRERNQPAA